MALAAVVGCIGGNGNGGNGWDDSPSSNRSAHSTGRDIGREVADADYSNDPGLPGWDGVRVSIRDDVSSMVEPTTDAEAAVQAPVDVVPTRSDLGSGVFVPAPIVELGCTTEIVCAHPWDCDTAMRVVKCETGGTFDPTVVGDDRERGCLQIHPVHWDKPQCDPEFLFDPAYNAACAYSIWEDSGWGPWSCY